MIAIITSVLAFVVAISLLVAVHEYGHFAVGRALGFKVLRFSIGFGRPLLSWTGRTGTDYVLAGIPLGGYVKFADEREAPVAVGDRAQAFNQRPVWARIAVLVAGPAANFFFAIVAFWILFQIGIPGLRPIIGDVSPKSVSAKAGFQKGDVLVAVNDRAVATEENALLALMGAFSDTAPITVTVRRSQETRVLNLPLSLAERHALTEPGAWSAGLGFNFQPPKLPTLVGALVPNGAAAAAGLQLGDRITSIDGMAVDDFSLLAEQIRRQPGATVKLGIFREGVELTLPVEVRAEKDSAHPALAPVGRIGVAPGGEPQWPEGMLTEERYGPVAALGAAVNETWEKSAFTVKLLGRMVFGQVSLKNVSGPLSIATYAGITARAGGAAFLSFLALISISLGVLNLMPVPILDGGQIVYQCAEAVRGKPLSERLQALGQQLGVAMLIVLMSLAFYNDIARHFG